MGRSVASLLALVLLPACNPSPPPIDPQTGAQEGRGPAATPEEVASTAAETPESRLAAVLAEQPEDVKARYPSRHPQETLEFFGIEPGMTVAEALPGSGWYSKILIPYLGAEGKLIGANYEHSMWSRLGFDQPFIDSMATWVQSWPQQAREWRIEDGAEIAAFEFGSLPADMEGTADAMLIVRALHNLARFEDEGEYLTTALNDVYRVLKPGGIVGIVQHKARDEMPDDWADGDAGYLKEQFVVDRMKEAGFEYVAASNLNENPKDRPTAEDVVWRLPPSLRTSAEDEKLRAEMQAIGESNRMTLKFRKPEGQAQAGSGT